MTYHRQPHPYEKSLVPNECVCGLRKDTHKIWEKDNSPTMTTNHTPGEDGWEREFDYLLFNHRQAIKHEMEGTNIGPYKHGVEEHKRNLLAFIRDLLTKQREEMTAIWRASNYEASFEAGRAAERAAIAERWAKTEMTATGLTEFTEFLTPNQTKQ